MRQLAQQSEALPLGFDTFYEGEDTTITWDSDKLFGCICDSSWRVGLGMGETQLAEWFGADCSLRKYSDNNML
jgi:hypothetical protein